MMLLMPPDRDATNRPIVSVRPSLPACSLMSTALAVIGVVSEAMR
jgi:hypothetical protein